VVTEAFPDSTPEQSAAPFEHASMSAELARIRQTLERMSRERNAVMRDLARAREAGQGRREAREPE
jgi:hypothetical protein